MSLFREQRRAVGRFILRLLRRAKIRFQRQRNLSHPETIPAKILIIRPFFLGDILLCLPVLQALKQARPDAQISWLIRREWTDLLLGHTPVDDLISFDDARLKGWMGWKEWWRVRKEIRIRHFDLVLNLTWDRSSMLWSLLSGISRTLGIEEYGRPRLLSLGYTDTVCAPDRSQDFRQMADYYYEPLTLLGFSKRTQSPEIHPTPEELEHVDWILGETIGQTEPYWLIHPGGRLGNKRWPADSYGELIRILACESTRPIVLTCGPGEMEWASPLAHHLPPHRGYYWPSPGLGEFMALARRAHTFIGNDSGPAHLAAATGCPVRALFGVDSTRWKPLGAQSLVLEQREHFFELNPSKVWDWIRENDRIHSTRAV